MRPQGPTFWLLDGRTGWRTEPDPITAVAVGTTIRLAAEPGGPLGLSGSGDDLGGLALPRGFALDEEHTLYLLGDDEPWIKRFDPEEKAFVRLASVGGAGSDARQFRRVRNIALAGGNLYCVDSGNNRVQVFDSESLALRYVWTDRDVPRAPSARRGVAQNDETVDEEQDGSQADVPSMEGDLWEPYDVAAGASAVYILDRRYGRVFRHRPGRDGLDLVIGNVTLADRWQRIAIDRKGRIYLLRRSDGEGALLDVYSSSGAQLETVADPGAVRQRFDPPPIRLSQDPRNPTQSRFCMAAGLLHLCDRRRPEQPPRPEYPLERCPPWEEDGLLFDRAGRALATIDPAAPLGPRLYEKEGTWISEALDSQIHECQWHRIELAVASLPAGTQIHVSTFTDDRPRPHSRIRDEQWDTHFTLTGRMRREQANAEADDDEDQAVEFLVLSGEGRYLRLRLQLEGDGYATPIVRAIRVHYPRRSYLNYLPAVYAADEESRRFLERFLSIFQTEWDRLEEELENIARYFDPRAVPPGPPLSYLASWLALALEGDWDEEQKRRLLAAAPEFYGRRGTMKALRRYLQVYVHNISGVEPGGEDAYPRIVEGFRERRFFQTALPDKNRLGGLTPLWGPSMVGRLQLDVFAREGDVRLVSTGDPERDLFHEYAHRFRVFVPATWIKSDDDERVLRRALEREKPAHTSYDLCLVEPRFRVGVQSTVGLDTIVGAYPVARLACPHSEALPPDQRPPPSRNPHHRLGYDTVLAGASGHSPGIRLMPDVRAGIDTTIT